MTPNGPRPTLSPAEEKCLQAYRDQVGASYRDEFGVHDEEQAASVAEAWFFCDEGQEHRFEELRKRLPDAKRILDLASGMGTATLHGLSRGLDCFGIEPDARKLKLMQSRIEAGKMPAEWKGRFPRAVGEELPFHKNSFDAILSYQTLEHVRDIRAVLGEMIRATRSGGGLHLRCPDYRGTFEGHYLLPWLPLMPRALARTYLRLLRRPLSGFEGIGYATQSRIVHRLRGIEKKTPGLRLRIVDLERQRFLLRLREKGIPGWNWSYPAWKLLRCIRVLFREELQMNLWVQVTKNPGDESGR